MSFLFRTCRSEIRYAFLSLTEYLLFFCQETLLVSSFRTFDNESFPRKSDLGSNRILTYPKFHQYHSCGLDCLVCNLVPLHTRLFLPFLRISPLLIDKHEVLSFFLPVVLREHHVGFLPHFSMWSRCHSTPYVRDSNRSLINKWLFRLLCLFHYLSICLRSKMLLPADFCIVPLTNPLLSY